MPGRKKQPLSVIQGKGRSNHITKEEADRRQRHEEKMKGSTDKVAPPSYLTKKQKDEFMEVAHELMKLDIFSNLDIDQLARYIDSRDQYIRVTKALRSMKVIEKQADDFGNEFKAANEEYDKLVKTRNKFFTECRQAASELGLSITARLKLVIPEQKDDNEPSKFERKFGNV